MRILVCVAGLWLGFAGIAWPATLSITNQTGQDIFNIHVTGEKQAFFLRLDLLPGATDAIENPDIVADLRVDTGLELWRFQKIDLKNALNLDFRQGNPVYLNLTDSSGKVARIDGTVTNMVPGPGAPPVCELEKFHPSMTMKEVCAIFPGQMPRDDNGAILTGLGFAGLTWASRLIPASETGVSENSLLEHLELRRPLTLADAEKAIRHLFQQGYVPWQAEFPGKESEFAQETPARSETDVLKQVRSFLAATLPGRHADHAAGKKCVEASILMAPADILPQLETADEPPGDVQLFTVTLRPCTGTLLLDVAAYRKN